MGHVTKYRCQMTGLYGKDISRSSKSHGGRHGRGRPQQPQLEYTALAPPVAGKTGRGLSTSSSTGPSILPAAFLIWTPKARRCSERPDARHPRLRPHGALLLHRPSAWPSGLRRYRRPRHDLSLEQTPRQRPWRLFLAGERCRPSGRHQSRVMATPSCFWPPLPPKSSATRSPTGCWPILPMCWKPVSGKRSTALSPRNSTATGRPSTLIAARTPTCI